MKKSLMIIATLASMISTAHAIQVINETNSEQLRELNKKHYNSEYTNPVVGCTIFEEVGANHKPILSHVFQGIDEQGWEVHLGAVLDDWKHASAEARAPLPATAISLTCYIAESEDPNIVPTDATGAIKLFTMDSNGKINTIYPDTQKFMFGINTETYEPFITLSK